jgi:hypothetical protein
MAARTKGEPAGDEVTIKDILMAVGEICPYGSFRHYAKECGLYAIGRQSIISGRATWLFPREAIKKLKGHIEARLSSRATAKAKVSLGNN